MGDTRFAFISTVIIVMSYFVAMTVDSLEKVLAYVGSTGSTSISFILPGLFYYKISDPDSILHQKLVKEDDDDDYSLDGGGDEGHDSQGTSRHWRKKLLRQMSLALAFYGMTVMVVCLITNTFFMVAH